MSPIIQLTDIHKRYDGADVPVHVLRGVSLTIERGEFVAIMGPSGSGKSTLMNTLGCLDQPTSGEYRLAGVNVESLDRDELAAIRNQKIGFVFQGFNLLPRTTALENVELPMLCGGTIDPDIVKQRAQFRLQQVGLAQREGHFPNQLSGGQQQRVAIARALVNHPEVIFADEPTGNLDSKTSEEIMGVFQSLNDAGVTVVLVTHEADIANYCKRKITLRDGEIIEDVAIEQRTRIAQPLTPVVEPAADLAHAHDRAGQLINLSIVLRVAFRSLRRAPMRTGLSLLGVVMGVAAVIAAVSIGNGASAEVEKTFSRISPNLLTVTTSMPRELWRDNKPIRVPYGDGLQLADYEAIKRNVNGLAAATIAVYTSVSDVTANGRGTAVSLTGEDVDGGDMVSRRIVQGTSFGNVDVRGSATVALISESVAHNLFDYHNPIGQFVTVNSTPFTVIGVIEDDVPPQRPSSGDVSDKTMIVPYSSVLQRIDPKAPLYMIVQAEHAAQLPSIRAEVKALLASRWGPRKAEVTLSDVDQQIREATKSKQTMTFLLGAIGSIALLVGAIDIMNMMLVSVTERTREIGIRLAIGTRGRDILLQFLCEAVMITVLGGLIGIVVGSAGAFLLTFFNNWATVITPNSVLIAVFISAAVGIFSGVYPARSAARLDPIQALRSE